LLYAVALLLPVLALMGFIAGEREIGGMLARDPDLLVKTLQSRTLPGKEPVLLHVAWGIRITLLSAIAGIFIARFIRQRWQRRGGVSRITYPDGRWIEVPHGFTVLEASQRLGVPHTSICGGKGRCSTCRIRVQADPGALPPPSLDEQRVLRAIRAPPNVRLACQLRPRGRVAIVPLVLSSKVRRVQFRAPVHAEAREQEIVILFADLRDFTQLAETRLPYDVVFILNRYFEEMGQAIEAAGGQVDKFIGDGLMALFGLDMSSPQASNQALVAARLMSLRLAELNCALAPNLDIPLRMGIGIHKGPAIVGEMGYGRTRSLTALGDTVNVASRLQALSKSHQCELVVSEDLLRSAGLDLPDEARREMEIRGRGAPIALYMIAAIDNITVKIPGPAASSATGSTTSKADLLILMAERFGIRPK
jgi:adenylate cyclase